MADHPLNAVNRGVYISDNLPFLQSLNDECVDLVCIDPPFAKNETFGRKNSQAPDPLKPPLSDEEKATEVALLQRWGIRKEQDATDAGINWPETKFKDVWNWRDVHDSWLKNIKDDYPGAHKLIQATQAIQGHTMASYLCYMAVRLIEIRRVLKPAGSLYLHCDPTANSYLRVALDAIMGKQNFVNEIVWRRYGSHNDSTKGWSRVHDTILFYTKSTDHTWTAETREPYDQDYISQAYQRQDEKGRYTTAPLHARGLSGGGYTFEWHGITDNWRFPRHSLDELESQGLINWPAKGTIPRRKIYLDLSKGLPIRDVINDIPIASSSENTGYPTQKPVALAERIIKASCPEGGVVLDCFAGCAYVAVAAERLKRNWVACDINPRAWTVFKRQFSKPKLALLTCDEPTHAMQRPCSVTRPPSTDLTSCRRATLQTKTPLIRCPNYMASYPPEERAQIEQLYGTYRDKLIAAMLEEASRHVTDDLTLHEAMNHIDVRPISVLDMMIQHEWLNANHPTFMATTAPETAS